MNSNKLPAFALGLIVASVIYPSISNAHNAIVEYQATEAISIEAKFDNGKPMANAQVVIYSPNNPSQPWQKGVTSEEGTFTFIPDYQQLGNWTAKVRLAGHGSVINIPIESSFSRSNIDLVDNTNTITESTSNTFLGLTKAQPNHTSLSFTQKMTMAIVGGWGFVGTALFFSRKNKTIS